MNAAGLQFSLANPAVAAVIPGASKPSRIAEDRAARSNLLLPLADGGKDVPTIFERPSGETARMTLTSVDTLDHGVLHLRYTLD